MSLSSASMISTNCGREILGGKHAWTEYGIDKCFKYMLSCLATSYIYRINFSSFELHPLIHPPPSSAWILHSKETAFLLSCVSSFVCDPLSLI